MKNRLFLTVIMILTVFILSGSIYADKALAVTVTITSNNPRDNNTSTGFNDGENAASQGAGTDDPGEGNDPAVTGDSTEAPSDGTSGDDTQVSAGTDTSDTQSDNASTTENTGAAGENTADGAGTDSSSISGEASNNASTAVTETVTAVPRTGDDNRVRVITTILVIALCVCIAMGINTIRNRE